MTKLEHSSAGQVKIRPALSQSSFTILRYDTLLRNQVPYTASPIIDTFQLGDTIWIEMDFSDHLTDLHGGITNTFSNFNFKLRFECDRFDINSPQGKAVSFMDAFPSVGEVVSIVLPISDVSYFEILPLYEAHMYRFKSAFVLKQQGSFLCGITPLSDDLAEPFKISGKCDDLPLYVISKVNNGDSMENNYHLLKSSKVPVYRDVTLERFGEGLFCFVVKP